MHQSTIFIIFAGLFLLACNSTTSDAAKMHEQKLLPRHMVIKDSLIIEVQPFSDIPDSLVNYVFMNVKKLCPYVMLNTSLSLPQNAYYKPRDRYKADSLLNYLKINLKKGHVVIGLTSKDISTSKGKIADWGVMGLGFCPGNACVISSFRLDKNNISDQLFKVAIHELGHTQGLDHCCNKTCIMRDAEGKNTTNEEKEFCSKCKAVLTTKGWVFRE